MFHPTIPFLAAILAPISCEHSPPPPCAPVACIEEPGPEPPDPWVKELASATVIAAGDILMHGPVVASARAADEIVDGVSTNHGGYDALFSSIRAPIQGADLAFVNLETPISPSGTQRRSMIFNAEPALLDAVVATGFDVVSLANNHIYDQGRRGLIETLDAIEARGELIPVGAAQSCDEAEGGKMIEVNGLKIAWLAASELFNNYLNADRGEACAFLMDVDQLLIRVQAAKEAGAEVVVLSLHWGDEYEIEPAPRHTRAAHRLIEGGVDLILGHHAHVVQPVEIIPTPDGRIGVVVYGMGNLISNQSAWYVPGLHDPSDGNPRDGLMVSLRLVRRRHGRAERAVIRTEISDLQVIPTWTLNNQLERRRGADPQIRVVPLLTRINDLQAQLDLGASSDATIVSLSRELDEMERRWRIVGGIVGAHLLPERPPELPAPAAPPAEELDEG